MAIGTNLPPQAYTRETLTLAFNWLQTQPEHVKQMAPNPAALVSLYTRSQRYGASETEAPVSSQNFISDLKELAEGLKQFEQPPVAAMPAPQASFQQTVAPRPAPSALNRPGTTMSAQAPAVVAPTVVAPTVSAAPAPQPQAATAVNSGTTAAAWINALHPTSQAMVAQLKDQFNLTSDTEAVNMMIAVAYKSLKNLI